MTASINNDIDLTPTKSDKAIYYRLIALWVICEAMLGGIIHGFKLPVSGLIVGSCAIICICLIAWYKPQKGMIIKATIIVAIFKMMLSPQAPPPAYIAVFFQGLLGEVVFWKRRWFTLSCILLAVLGLLESGLQRILMLTIVYGNDLWKVVNNFFNGLTKQKESTNYSLFIGGGYIALHFLTGIFIGWWASRLPARVIKWQLDDRYTINVSANTDAELPAIKRKGKRFKIILFFIWILLIVLYVQSYFKVGNPILPSHISFKILLRSLIIVLGWVFIIGPILTRLLHSWLEKRKSRSKEEVQQVLSLLPATRTLITTSWRQSENYTGFKRLNEWSKTILVNALTSNTPNDNTGVTGNIYILTGPIQTGKTTSLVSWAEKRNDVYGILTPVVNNKRVFMNTRTREQFPMEADSEENEVLEIGRFRFSKKYFQKAINIIEDAIEEKGWLVIDEIGPMELKGQGFSDVLTKIILKRSGNLLLIVRDKDNMLEKVQANYYLQNAFIIHSINELPV